MGTPEHFREQAHRCRTLAAEQPTSVHVGRWLSLAANYDGVAAQLEDRRRRVTDELMRRSRGTPVPIIPEI
jgi:hypothetical protein